MTPAVIVSPPTAAPTLIPTSNATSTPEHVCDHDKAVLVEIDAPTADGPTASKVTATGQHRPKCIEPRTFTAAGAVQRSTKPFDTALSCEVASG